MSNIFRSKEVFKKISKDVYDKDTIVPVRGVYISGEYRPPYYNNPGVQITKIETKKATVVSYTTEYTETEEPFTIGLMGFSSDSSIQITKYGSEDKHVYDTFTIGLMGFDVSEPTFVKYGREYDDTYDNFTIGLMGFEESDAVSYHRYKIYEDQQPEPCIRLTKLVSTKAEITSGVQSE